MRTFTFPHRAPWTRIRLGVLVAIAIVLYAVHAPVLASAYDVGVVGMLLAIPASAAVVLSAVNPRAAVGLVLAGTAVIAVVAPGAGAAPYPWTVPSMLAVFTCCIVLGASAPLRPAGITWGTFLALALLLELLSGSIHDPFYVVLTLTAISVLIGAGFRLLRASEARADAHAEIGAREREAREILEEKAKVARELHDVVAHHMSVISVQAASAEYRLDGLSEQAREEFREIGRQSRSSLAELRRILGVLRGDDAQLALAPQPGVADLPRVIAAVGRAGTEVTVCADELSALPDPVSLATYRIVQEALSNAVRHAPGAPVALRIRRSVGAVELTVSNPPAATAAAPLGGTGHGLRGMRERAAALHGTLSAGPRPDGGFEVRAWLPLLPEDGGPEPGRAP